MILLTDNKILFTLKLENNRAKDLMSMLFQQMSPRPNKSEVLGEKSGAFLRLGSSHRPTEISLHRPTALTFFSRRILSFLLKAEINGATMNELSGRTL